MTITEKSIYQSQCKIKPSKTCLINLKSPNRQHKKNIDPMLIEFPEKIFPTLFKVK